VAVVRPAAGGGSEVFFVWTDQLDTPRVISDDENRIRWEWDANDPFGNNAPNEDPSGMGAFHYNLRFPGQYFDAETGLDYNYFRDYDPSIARYVESDRTGLRGGISTYSYAAANPLTFIDPLGLLVVHIWNFAGSADAWGHASMTLDDGTHISWWPSGNDRRGSLYPSTPLYTAPANDPQTMDDDVQLEGRIPDRDIRIDGLDEAAIKKWWIAFKAANKWKTLTQNCSTTAAEALSAGGARKFSILGGGFPIHGVWSPEDVANYAKSTNNGIERWNRIREFFR
jgi:RHS repeat-associated protein